MVVQLFSCSLLLLLLTLFLLDPTLAHPILTIPIALLSCSCFCCHCCFVVDVRAVQSLRFDSSRLKEAETQVSFLNTSVLNLQQKAVPRFIEKLKKATVWTYQSKTAKSCAATAEQDRASAMWGIVGTKECDCSLWQFFCAHCDWMISFHVFRVLTSMHDYANARCQRGPVLGQI